MKNWNRPWLLDRWRASTVRRDVPRLRFRFEHVDQGEVEPVSGIPRGVQGERLCELKVGSLRSPPRRLSSSLPSAWPDPRAS